MMTEPTTTEQAAAEPSDWPWPTLDIWCADFEKGLRQSGMRIIRREPTEAQYGYIYVLEDAHEPTNGNGGCYIPVSVTKFLMPRTQAARVCNEIRGVVE